MSRATITICGGGNGAHAAAVFAARNGYQVNIFAPYGDEAQRLQAGVQAGGGIEALLPDGSRLLGRVERISGQAADVIPKADVVLLVAPAFSHQPILDAVVPHLAEGAWLGAMPSRGGFEFVASALLAHAGKGARIFGLQTLPWACRLEAYGQRVRILGAKHWVACAAVGVADEARTAAALLAAIFGLEVRPLPGMISVTLANPGQIIHPGIMVGLLAGREHETYPADEVPLFYQGVTPRAVELLEGLSAEVCGLARRISADLQVDLTAVTPLYDWLIAAYGEQIADRTDLLTSLRTNQAYAGLTVPTVALTGGRRRPDLQSRYLTEDVPYGLMVTRGIAALAGAATPTIDYVLGIVGGWHKKRYIVGEPGASRLGPDAWGTRAPQAHGIDNLDDLIACERQGGSAAWAAAQADSRHRMAGD